MIPINISIFTPRIFDSFCKQTFSGRRGARKPENWNCNVTSGTSSFEIKDAGGWRMPGSMSKYCAPLQNKSGNRKCECQNEEFPKQESVWCTVGTDSLLRKPNTYLLPGKPSCLLINNKKPDMSTTRNWTRLWKDQNWNISNSVQKSTSFIASSWRNFNLLRRRKSTFSQCFQLNTA